ncbi:tryptophan synthase alpha chain [Natranaerovirga hydrolytica]|uniref:Tryptophan synthase alpha chain n=1 Tax=Natranaerovirga hydrolytica TaxID=680378 RepID=A0A4V2Q1M6_9FIRM|nr:tryptophan synthase subunit alpha [Natranaerovirga hydrolytica]TCK98221.1 tryptophan synthase alpha chain [Natranaerovirga hydrolytica]
MNRIEIKLANLKQKNEKAFITYIMAGYPDENKTKALILEQAKAGVDILEIGVPFSDPVADGSVIQEVGAKALANGMSHKKVLNIVKDVRKECDVPIILMLYYNTVLHYGLDHFVEDCIKVGVDGLIIPDLPLEEQDELTALLTTDALINIQLVAPTSLKRLPKILEQSKGFLYCISSLGVTGQEHAFHGQLGEFLTTLKSKTDMPLMLGFGITKPEDINPIENTIDGVIVGSAFINEIKKNEKDISKAIEWCQSFKKALN